MKAGALTLSGIKKQKVIELTRLLVCGLGLRQRTRGDAGRRGADSHAHTALHPRGRVLNAVSFLPGMSIFHVFIGLPRVVMGARAKA